MLNLQEFSPCVLLAMPQMRDPNFYRAVIVLAEFTPAGAFGVVMNRPLEMTLGAVQSPRVHIAERYRAATLWFGGPVNHQQALLLSVLRMGTEIQMAGKGGRVTLGDVSSGDAVVLPLGGQLVLANPRAMVVGHEIEAMEGDFKILVGYSGWSANQLDSELAGGAWLVTPLDPTLIFSDPQTMWARGIQSLGVDPAVVQVPPSAARH